MLLLIAAGLARPAVTSLGSLWGGAHSAVVIILDNSASMGMIDQDRVRFDTAAAAAGQILDQLTEGDQVALLVTCGPAFPDADKLDRTQDAVRQILGQCRVSYERADLAAKVRAGPGAAGQVGRPQQADLRAHRHAEALVGGVEDGERAERGRGEKPALTA